MIWSKYIKTIDYGWNAEPNSEQLPFDTSKAYNVIAVVMPIGFSFSGLKAMEKRLSSLISSNNTTEHNNNDKPEMRNEQINNDAQSYLPFATDGFWFVET